MIKLSIVSGGFDPLHVGHLELFERAKSLAYRLFVIVNNDQFLIRKKGKPFMPFAERMRIVESIYCVDKVIPCADTDDTVCRTLENIYDNQNNIYDEIMFCNGGDRTNGENTPEHKICEELGITSVYGLGEKVQSSSWLIRGR